MTDPFSVQTSSAGPINPNVHIPTSVVPNNVSYIALRATCASLQPVYSESFHSSMWGILPRTVCAPILLPCPPGFRRQVHNVKVDTIRKRVWRSKPGNRQKERASRERREKDEEGSPSTGLKKSRKVSTRSDVSGTGRGRRSSGTSVGNQNTTKRDNDDRFESSSATEDEELPGDVPCAKRPLLREHCQFTNRFTPVTRSNVQVDGVLLATSVSSSFTHTQRFFHWMPLEKLNSSDTVFKREIEGSCSTNESGSSSTDELSSTTES